MQGSKASGNLLFLDMRYRRDFTWHRSTKRKFSELRSQVTSPFESPDTDVLKSIVENPAAGFIRYAAANALFNLADDEHYEELGKRALALVKSTKPSTSREQFACLLLIKHMLQLGLTDVATEAIAQVEVAKDAPPRLAQLNALLRGWVELNNGQKAEAKAWLSQVPDGPEATWTAKGAALLK